MTELIRCPKCHSLISDIAKDKGTYICPNCKHEFKVGISLDAESYSEHKARSTKVTNILISLIVIAFVIMLIIGVSPIVSLIGDFLTPINVGDVCYVRDGTLCDKKYCGGEFIRVQENAQCIVEEKDVIWYK